MFKEYEDFFPEYINIDTYYILEAHYTNDDEWYTVAKSLSWGALISKLEDLKENPNINHARICAYWERYYQFTLMGWEKD